MRDLMCARFACGFPIRRIGIILKALWMATQLSNLSRLSTRQCLQKKAWIFQICGLLKRLRGQIAVDLAHAKR